MNGVQATSPAPVPDVSFRGLDGEVARLESFRGRPILLTFFTTW
jgi:peroxiredoxin